MYSSDNNNLHDHRIEANQLLNLIESLGDDQLTAFFKQMDYTEDEKLLYLYQKLNITPKYDKNNKLLSVSETDQLAAVNKNPYTIYFIIDKGIIPSEDVQLAAVNKYGEVIQYIENPSEDVQLAAVNEKGNAIKHIIRKGIIPSEDVQLAAVNKTGYAIYHIIQKGITPSEDVQLAAVNKDVRAIRFIKKPSEKVKQLARGKGMKNV